LSKKNVKRRRRLSSGPCGQQIVRGYFSLGDWEVVVHITSNADFLVYIWARNIETFAGGVQITTPPSQFRGRGSTGPNDGLVLDVPPQTGKDLGCIGGHAGETIDITNAAGARVTVFVTLITAQGATANMIMVER
jgi:hypothetical protein